MHLPHSQKAKGNKFSGDFTTSVRSITSLILNSNAK